MSALYGEVRRATLHARLGSWSPTSASSLQGKVPDTTKSSSEGWLPVGTASLMCLPDPGPFLTPGGTRLVQGAQSSDWRCGEGDRVRRVPEAHLMQVPGRRTPERTGSRGDSYHGAWPELGGRRTTPSSRLRLSRLRPSRGRGPTQDMTGRMQLPRSRSQLWPAGSCTRSSGNKDC